MEILSLLILKIILPILIRKLLVVSDVNDQVIVNTKNAILVTKKNSSHLLRDVMKVIN